MTGSELKTFREDLGWTQQDMADNLEMSRKMIGLMEREDVMVSKRTELAVLYLYEHMSSN